MSDLAAFLPVDKFLQIKQKSQNLDQNKYQAMLNWHSRMRIILKQSSSSYSPADFTKYATDIDTIDEKFIVLKRRYTRRLETENLSENICPDSNRHAKVTKSSIQSLELSSKNDLTEVISSIPVNILSNEISEKDLGTISFSGSAKPIEGGLGDARAVRKAGFRMS